MQCRNCGYALWNLRPREGGAGAVGAGAQCPECGLSFRVSDYQFKPNTVQFCCPHCSQAYYGTDPQGLLQPRAFECVSCRKYIHIDEMVLLPAPGVTDTQTGQSILPWAEGAEAGAGRFKRWWRTVVMSLVHPSAIGERLHSSENLGKAFSFWLITSFIGLVGAMSLGFGVLLIPLFMGAGGRGGATAAAIMLLVLLGALLAAMIFSLVYLALWALCTHLILVVSKSPNAGLGRTFQTLYYASGVNIINAIPCVGTYISPVWMIVSATLIGAKAHRLTGGRAALAFVTPPVAFFVLAISAYMGVVFFAMSRGFAGPGGPMVTYAPGGSAAAQAQLSRIHLALTNFYATSGSYPMHAAQLLAGPTPPLVPTDFATETFTGATSRVGGTPLDQLARSPRTAIDAAVLVAMQSQPADVVAHRIGDFVFTYHGISDPPQDNGLWLAVYSPQPVNPWGASPALVLLADGSRQTISVAAALPAQNQLRAQFGLPPLNDPDTITEAAPQRASDADKEIPVEDYSDPDAR